MVDKVTLGTITSFVNDTTAANVFNNNMALITTAMDNTLSRDGTLPNTMGTNLDMNSNQILNLPAPASATSPARLMDVVSPATIASVPPVGTSGAVVGLLNANKTDSGNNTHTGTNTFTNTVTLPNQTITAAEIVNNTITNAQIANNTVGFGQLLQGVSVSVIGRSTNSSGNLANIQATGNRQVLSTNVAGTSLGFSQPQGDQLLGTVTNDNATAGNVGEYVSTSAGPTSLTTAVPLTISSFVLTAGDWNIWGVMQYSGGATTTVTSEQASISTTTNVLQNNGYTYSSKVYNAQTVYNVVSADTLLVGPVRISIASPTTYFFVAQSNFATSTCTAQGFLNARRIR